MRKMTMEDIEAGRSPAGGFTRDTLASWGVPWPPKKGWQQRLIQYGIPDEHVCTCQTCGRTMDTPAAPTAPAGMTNDRPRLRVL